MQPYKNDDDYINTLEGKNRYNILLSQEDQDKLKKWEKEQENLKNNLCHEDDPLLNDIMFIGGLDISYDKNDKKSGISGLVILDYRSLNIVYEDYNLVKIDEPYIPGFLAFREVKHLVKLVENLKMNASQFLPQVILLDGNGILHPKGFGLACHLGVLTDMPTIGCSKSVFSIDGITKDKVKEIAKNNLKNKGDSYELIGSSGRQWGYALKSSKEDEDPLIISMGNKISNQMALKIVKKMCKKRIPEPIRLADLITRRLIKARKKYGTKNNIWNWNLKDYLDQNHEYLHKNLDQCLDDEKDNQNETNEINSSRGRGMRGNYRGNFRGRGRASRGNFRGREGMEGEENKEDLLNEDKEKEIFRGRGRGFYRGEERGRGSFRGRGRGFYRGEERGRGFYRGEERGRGPFRGRGRRFFRGRGRRFFRGDERGRGPFRGRDRENDNN